MSVITKKYTTTNAINRCPIRKCLSEDIEGGGVAIEGKYALQEVTCNDCGTVWQDEYKLQDFHIKHQSQQVNIKHNEVRKSCKG